MITVTITYRGNEYSADLDEEGDVHVFRNGQYAASGELYASGMIVGCNAAIPEGAYLALEAALAKSIEERG